VWRIDFDKKRAEELIEAVRCGKPVVVSHDDLLLMAGVCLSLREWTEMEVSSAPQKLKEHREMEIERFVWDGLAGLIAVKILLDSCEIGDYDDSFDPKVTIAAELTREPTVVVKVTAGARPGCPYA